jgi:plasmid stabilization system protein ParE
MVSKKYNLELYSDAYEDFDRYFLYYLYATQDFEKANEICAKLIEKINGICFMPRSHPKIGDDSDENMRKLIYKNFIVQFYIDDQTDTIYVLRIFQAKMDYKQYI